MEGLHYAFTSHTEPSRSARGAIAPIGIRRPADERSELSSLRVIYDGGYAMKKSLILTAFGLLVLFPLTRTVAADYQEDAAWISFELAPPDAAAKDETFEVVAVGMYDPGSPASLAEYEYTSGPNMVFYWEFNPDGEGDHSEQDNDAPPRVYSKKSTANVTYDMPSTQVDDKTVRVRIHVTGEILYYGFDDEKGTDDDEIYPIDEWSDWVSGDLTVYEAELKVRRNGSGNEYGATAIVAAGGLATAVHKADVEVSTTPAVQGVCFYASIKEGEGQGQPDTGGAANLDIGSTTEGNGKITGTYTSSNRTENVTLELRNENEVLLDTATVNQQWDTDDSDNWTYDGYFSPDTWEDVSFTLKLTDGEDAVPIPGHNMKFYAWAVIYYEWNDETLEYDEKLEVISESNNYDLSFYSDFNPTTKQGTAGGVSDTSQIVYEDAELDWFVDEVFIVAVDKSVYQ